LINNHISKNKILTTNNYLYSGLKTIVMNRIKEVLAEKGVKQKWLAEQLGKSYNMVNSYVQNRQQPRLEILYKIAEILDVDVKDLLIDNPKN
jgi:putative transcriptional regulator